MVALDSAITKISYAILAECPILSTFLYFIPEYCHVASNYMLSMSFVKNFIARLLSLASEHDLTLRDGDVYDRLPGFRHVRALR